MEHLIQTSYITAAFLFILGLKRMGSPKTDRSGIIWAGWAMLLAVVVTFFWPGLENYALMVIAVVVGSLVAGIAAKKVPMTDMPQMIAIYNGMGGGAAGAIGALELVSGHIQNPVIVALAIIGGLIGAVAFSGSCIAFARLQGIMGSRPTVFKGQNLINGIMFAVAVACGIGVFMGQGWLLLPFFALTLIFGVTMTLPIGGGDMPVVISLYNALTGLAVGFEGFALGNAAMIVAGIVVGAAGSLLTYLMAKAMNRSLFNVLFSAFGQDTVGEAGGTVGEYKELGVEDAAIMMAFANKVVVIPGYGMAVAQAQHKVRELTDLLTERGVMVKFAVHPVAGRMPGHMNVLLAEANVSYDALYDLEDINGDFTTTDVSLVIGANDVVNPAARNNTASPIYGMPILNADASKNVICLKRGRGKGFAGIENELFFTANTHMVFGDANDTVAKFVQEIKRL